MIKVVHDVELDDNTVQISDDHKVFAEWSNNTGVPLSFGAIDEVIAEARDKKISIVDYRKQTVEVSDDISFRHLNVLLPNTTFVMVQRGDGSFPNVELGGSSNTPNNPYQELGDIRRSTFKMGDLDPTKLQGSPSAIIRGAKNQSIKIHHVDYLRLELSANVQSNSIAYSTFDFNFVQRLEITPDEAGMQDASLWCNENVFNIRRLYGLDMRGAYHHNANVFFGSSVDYKNSYLNIEQGKNNQFLHFRLEEVANITFGERTEFNVLDISWYSSLPKLLDIGAKTYTITDNGRFNRIVRMPERHFEKQRVGYATGNPLTANKTWTEVYTTNKFEFRPKEDFLVFEWDNNAASHLVTVYCFDRTGAQILPNAFTSPFLTARQNTNRLEGNYRGGQKYGTRYLYIDDPRVETVKVGFGNNGVLTQALSTKFTVDLYSTGPRAMLPSMQVESGGTAQPVPPGAEDTRTYSWKKPDSVDVVIDMSKYTYTMRAEYQLVALDGHVFDQFNTDFTAPLAERAIVGTNGTRSMGLMTTHEDSIKSDKFGDAFRLVKAGGGVYIADNLDNTGKSMTLTRRHYENNTEGHIESTMTLTVENDRIVVTATGRDAGDGRSKDAYPNFVDTLFGVETGSFNFIEQ